MYIDYFEKQVTITAEQMNDICEVYEAVCAELGVQPYENDEDEHGNAIPGKRNVDWLLRADLDTRDSVIYNATCASDAIKESAAYKRIAPILDYLTL